MRTAESIRKTGASCVRSARRAFTLVEIVVAIGILAIVGVVIGSIFASVGDTVTQGRQVSNLNRFVARVERVMRRDFESMVRENGFMVIRNETTSLYNGNRPTQLPVGLTVTDAAPRPRRIDEIMFFSRGDYQSRRTPLHPDMIAKSDVARIYYGHGQQMPEDFGNGTDLTTPYAKPRVDEPNNRAPGNRLGQPSSLGVVNPNEFASNWSLLRHVTPLVARQTGLQTLPDNVLGLSPNTIAADYNRVADSSRQVALGPAAQSVFRSIAHLEPYELSSFPGAGGELIRSNEAGFNIRPQNGYSALYNGQDGPANETLARPLFMSGIVDVAVTDLEEIRRTVTRTYNLGNPGIEFAPTALMLHDYTSTTDRLGFESGVLSTSPTGVPLIATAIADPAAEDPVYEGGFQSRPQSQQLWMLDALPSVAYDPTATNPDQTGYRMRYEDVPPRVYLESGAAPSDAEAQRQIAIEQADQAMLASSVFVPRCTEFIVEWSLGIVDRRTSSDTYGQQIWHGLRRTAGGVVSVDSFSDEFDGVRLVDRADQQNDMFAIRGALPSSVFEDGNQPTNGTAIEGGIDQEIIELIRMEQRFPPLGNPADEVIAEYCFGYVYQDWNTDVDDDDDTFAAGDADDVERPWPWPAMVRVTMRFVDPGDLENEQTFQFEFRVPGLRGGL